MISSFISCNRSPLWNLRLRAVLAPGVLGLTLTSPALAQTILLDQQPSQAFSLWSQAGTASNADQLVLAAPEAVGEFSIWGTMTGSGNSNSDTFDVYFKDNDTSGPFGDVPGTTTYGSFLGLSPTWTVTGASMPTSSGLLPEYRLDFVLPASVALPAGTAWLELYSTGSSGSGDTFAWEMAPQDPVAGAACIAWSNQTPGVTWNACTPLPETDFALQVRTSGSVGISYCTSTPNSTGAASVLTATGSTSLGANDLVLSASDLPAQPGIFIAGPSATQTPFFNGFLCVDPAGLQRFATINTPVNGTITEAVDLATSAPGGLNAAAGASYYYQRWNRDPAGGGAAANFSDGLEIPYGP